MSLEDNESILDGDEAVETPEKTEGQPDGAAPEAETDAPAGDVTDKRVRDLQSKADKAEARANKAEAELQKLLARGESPTKGSDPERDALMVELREASLDAVFAEFTDLHDYAIDRSLIEGTTRAQMRESATSLVALIKSVETKARNQTLREHGFVVEPVGSSRTPPKSYADMSAEEIEKEIARVRNGGAGSLW